MKVKIFLATIFLFCIAFIYSFGQITIKNTTGEKIVVLLEFGEEGTSYKTHALGKNKEIKDISNINLKEIKIYKDPLEDTDGNKIAIKEGETQTIINLPEAMLEQKAPPETVIYLITKVGENYAFGAPVQ